MTAPEHAEATFAELTQILTNLGVAITTREEFEQAFAAYQKDWRTYFPE